MEYIAVFLAVLFPGALVAFDYDLLQALPRLTALRVYCAGIWHNAVVISQIYYQFFMFRCFLDWLRLSLAFVVGLQKSFYFVNPGAKLKL